MKAQVFSQDTPVFFDGSLTQSFLSNNLKPSFFCRICNTQNCIFLLNNYHENFWLKISFSSCVLLRPPGNTKSWSDQDLDVITIPSLESEGAISEISKYCAMMQIVLDALRARKHKFLFEGTSMSLQSSVMAFITMNPGYPGRAELPGSPKVPIFIFLTFLLILLHPSQDWWINICADNRSSVCDSSLHWSPPVVIYPELPANTSKIYTLINLQQTQALALKLYGLHQPLQ